MKRTFLLLSALILVAAPLLATPKTIENLQAAYNGESNAHARYVAFAEKADQDGYPSVASMFRAAARAEQIHANNHAEVIKKLGAEPKATIDKPEIKTTAENLEAAIKGEKYEFETMYPEFLKEAHAANEVAAVKTFNYAYKAEGEHAKLYSDLRKNIETIKGAKQTYYVCEVCGYTTTKVDFERCPGCLQPKDKYVAVS